MLRILACVLSLTATASTFGGRQSGGGDAKAGKRSYVNYGCYQCHGYEAQGAQATGPRLAPDPIAFAEFAAYLREPKGEMPPYTVKAVSDQELKDIYAFLKSVPRPPDSRSIPLLQ
jgi:ubiquinol-cytochrome c reductase cytochrome c subunit